MASFAGGGEGVPGSERQTKARGTVRSIVLCRVVPVPSGGGRRAIRAHCWNFGSPRTDFFREWFEPSRERWSRLDAERDQSVGSTIYYSAKDRRLGPKTAPAHGLTLWRVGYDEDEPGR